MNYGIAYTTQLANKSEALYRELDEKIVALSELMLADNAERSLKSAYQVEIWQASAIKKDDLSSYISNKLLDLKITGQIVTIAFFDMSGGTIVAQIEPSL